VIPAYNAAATIGEAIESVLAQDADDWELVITDDGSTDETRAICDRYVAADSRISVGSQDNAGTGAAINAGIKRARGEFIVLIGADDLLLPEFVFAMGGFMHLRPGCDIYACNAYRQFPDGRRELYHTDPRFAEACSLTTDDLLTANYIYGAAAFRRELWERLGGFRTEFYNEDYDFWLRALISGATHIYNPLALAAYRVTPGQKSADEARMRREDVRVLEAAIESGMLTAEQTAHATRAIRHHVRNAAFRERLTTMMGPKAARLVFRTAHAGLKLLREAKRVRQGQAGLGLSSGLPGDLPDGSPDAAGQRELVDLAGAPIIFVNNFGPGLGGGEAQLLVLIESSVQARMAVTCVCQRGSALAEEAAGLGAHVVETEFAAHRLASAVSAVGAAVREALIGGTGSPDAGGLAVCGSAGAGVGVGVAGRPLAPGDWPTSTHAGPRCILVGTGYLTNLVVRVAASLMGIAGGSLALLNIVHVEPNASLLDGGSRLGQMIRTLAERTTRRKGIHFVAVSKAVASALTDGLGIDVARVSVVRNGIDPAAVRRAAVAAAGVLTAELGERDDPSDDGLALGRPLLGCAARLEPVKGLDVLLRAVALLREAQPHGVGAVVLAGSGSQEAVLRRLAADLGLTDELIMPGFVAALPPLLAQIDLFVMPSLSEGFPLVLLEAMALGKPVVASAVGGIPEVVEDGVTGVLVPPKDPQALADAIGELLGDPDKVAAMGKAGQDRVEGLFTQRQMTAAYLELFAHLLHRS